VYAHGIEVLDGADDDDVVGQIAHHLQLVFFPTQNRFFDQHFVDGRKVQPPSQDLQQFFAIVGKAAAAAAQRERRANDRREPNLDGKLQAVLQVVDQRRSRNVQADAGHGVFEQQAVFCLFDGL